MHFLPASHITHWMVCDSVGMNTGCRMTSRLRILPWLALCCMFYYLGLMLGRSSNIINSIEIYNYKERDDYGTTNIITGNICTIFQHHFDNHSNRTCLCWRLCIIMYYIFIIMYHESVRILMCAQCTYTLSILLKMLLPWCFRLSLFIKEVSAWKFN